MALYIKLPCDDWEDARREWLRRYPPDETPGNIMARPGDRDKAILKRLPKGPIRGVEVGVHEGWLSSQLLKARPDLTLYMVDIWADPRHMATAVKAVEKAGDRAVIMHMPSTEAAKGLDNLDFVFIDADHEYESVKADILAWKPKTRLLCGHDYKETSTMFNGVVRAVNELLTDVEFDKDKTWFSRG